ncbi:MAG: hypothetical protein LW850_03715 [Planctomycetaceae bacterium]|nr:hypothetical protein [Planctomycetaceae bacterium]
MHWNHPPILRASIKLGDHSVYKSALRWTQWFRIRRQFFISLPELDQYFLGMVFIEQTNCCEIGFLGWDFKIVDHESGGRAEVVSDDQDGLKRFAVALTKCRGQLRLHTIRVGA